MEEGNHQVTSEEMALRRTEEVIVISSDSSDDDILWNEDSRETPLMPSSLSYNFVAANCSTVEEFTLPTTSDRDMIEKRTRGQAGSDVCVGEVLPPSVIEKARSAASENKFSLPMYDDDDIKKIEEKTRGQSNNELWHRYGTGCIGASEFRNVVTNQGRDTTSLIKRLMRYKSPNPDIPNLKYGRETELTARKCYIEQMRRKGHDLQVTECGLFFHPEKTFIKASPDGLVTCNSCKDCGEGLLEIKCPVKYKEDEPAPWNTEYLEDNGGEIQLKREHRYYSQVQTQLAVTGRAWCDFFVYKPGGVFMERIKFARVPWNRDAVEVEKFFWKHIVPELVHKRIQKMMKYNE